MSSTPSNTLSHATPAASDATLPMVHASARRAATRARSSASTPELGSGADRSPTGTLGPPHTRQRKRSVRARSTPAMLPQCGQRCCSPWTAPQRGQRPFSESGVSQTEQLDGDVGSGMADNGNLQPFWRASIAGGAVERSRRPS
ncbi:MAG TPA: hypothetical protein VKY39_08920, partial [Aggregatilineales bacterium]|nr:hypothetical protein [Aggregatilineales bacterium]